MIDKEYKKAVESFKKAVELSPTYYKQAIDRLKIAQKGRLKASTVPGAMGNRGNITLILTEFADPSGKVCYFRVPDLSKADADELTGLWESSKGGISSMAKPSSNW